MQPKQSLKSPNNSLNVARLLAVGAIATGGVAILSVESASAITFNGGQLDFGVFTSPFTNAVDPVPGNNFNVTFNPSGTTNIFTATGDFSPTFTGGTIVGSNSPTVNFGYVGGNTYRLNSDLVFNFAAATPTSFTIRQNSTFTQTDIFNNGLKVGTGLQLALDTGSFFTNDGNISNIPTLSFSLNDTGLPSGGLFIVQASPTAVPEPFTIIGTLVGGTAALRMRKKLSDASRH